MIEHKRPRLASSPSSSSSAAAASSSSGAGDPILDGDGDGAADGDEFGRGDDEGTDHLTALPDTLRLHILTLLPLKSAIRVSSLSSRWRDLWRYRWPQPAELRLPPSSSSPSSSPSPADFVACADSALLDRGPERRIDALAISLPPGRRYDGELKRWLARAAACGVVDLRIDILGPVLSSACVGSKRARRKDPAADSSIAFQSLCDCHDLVRLAVSGVRLQRPLSSRIASLEVLVLDGAQVTTPALKKVVSCCPGLRSLEVKRCHKLWEIAIEGNRHQFESLTIVDCQTLSLVNVSAPCLRRFRFSGDFLPRIRLFDVDGLEDIYMSAGWTAETPKSNWMSNLGKLWDVKVLTLCNFSLQIAVSVPNAIELRNFKRLTELQLIMGMMTEGNLLDIYSFFRLYDCTGLEKLFVELPTGMRDSFLPKYLPEPEEEAPLVDFANLRRIKVNNFKGHKLEMRLLEFLLGNADSLESLLVVAPRELMMEECDQNIAKDCSGLLQSMDLQLSLLKKASKNAKVIIKDYDDYKFLPTHYEF